MGFSLTEKFNVAYAIGGDFTRLAGFTTTALAANRQRLKHSGARHEAAVSASGLKLSAAPNLP